ncbi:hypothetical protein T12_10180 [Trichinella patagoniensis]|uniref:Uncharacterized protein n=1 Tax=Trichinella patagoniensis TaxID=990121 RepID=A0A0V0ZBC1_9BILA|nr:hypothetical protein T12_10180 [Trichinella patagoniensis]
MYGKYYFEKSTLDTNVLPNDPRSKLSENHVSRISFVLKSVPLGATIDPRFSRNTKYGSLMYQLQNTDVLRKGFFHLEMVDEKSKDDDDGDELFLLQRQLQKQRCYQAMPINSHFCVCQ